MEKIIDCHCHIYPEKIAAKAVDSICEFYSAAMFGDGTRQGLLDRDNVGGIANAVVFSVATTPAQVNRINKFIAENADNSEGRLTGLGTLHPDSENIEGDIEYLISLGLKGVKLHPDFIHTDIDDERFMKIYEILEGRLPILFHCGDFRFNYSNPDKLKNVLERFPKLTVIGAHFGGWSIWKEATEALSGYKQLYVDTSSSLFGLTKEEAVKCIRSFGAQRVLFGSDFPMWDPVTEVKIIKSLGLTDDELDCIFWKNASKLFDIKL